MPRVKIEAYQYADCGHIWANGDLKNSRIPKVCAKCKAKSWDSRKPSYYYASASASNAVLAGETDPESLRILIKAALRYIV
ncbi:MAG: hypothetical protein ACREBS_05005 [Nitrososphaerales archaeon]